MLKNKLKGFTFPKTIETQFQQHFSYRRILKYSYINDPKRSYNLYFD